MQVGLGDSDGAFKLLVDTGLDRAMVSNNMKLIFSILGLKRVLERGLEAGF